MIKIDTCDINEFSTWPDLFCETHQQWFYEGDVCPRYHRDCTCRACPIHDKNDPLTQHTFLSKLKSLLNIGG